MKLQARSVHQGSAKTFNILAFGRIHRETPSTGRRSKGHSSPEQDARVERGGRRRIVYDRRADREKKGKGSNFRRKVVDVCTGGVKAKEFKHRVARSLKHRENVLTPFAKSKVF